MQIEFDANKRDWTFVERGLEFGRAAEVFLGPHHTRPDARRHYGEDRYLTIGLLDQRVVVVVWTQRGHARRIISMRKANEREIAYFARNSG
ncbi:BrnT family toxin [Paraburkholderia acidisoli]|uniref:BrnT family toxin n=1 Tax=Paraburkholderia acidisoli TaxID=2571748 RepID=A0A7Z2JJ08_9BURK|nr:BrnT family toxin [Paraburkholderia acidisoli]QGZ64884.1 BrnT family toxin [Paraburkholderia acidisoli]